MGLKKGLSFLFIWQLVSGCALFKVDNAPMEIAVFGLSGSDGEAFFAFNLLPWFRDTMDCKRCHTHCGTANPAFAYAQGLLAYNETKLVTNFNDPGSSLLVTKMKQAHNCGNTCAQAENYLIDAIAAWKVAEESGTGSNPVALGDVVLPSQVVPADLPAVAVPPAAPVSRTLTWDLDSVTGLGGLDLTIEIIQYDDFAYLVRNPRIIFPSGVTLQIYIKGLRLGIIPNAGSSLTLNPQYTTWSAVDTIIATNASFSPSQPLLPKIVGPGSDYVFASFEALEVTSGTGAGLSFYVNNVIPAMSAASCDNCHFVGGSGLFHVFNYNQIFLRLSTPG